MTSLPRRRVTPASLELAPIWRSRRPPGYPTSLLAGDIADGDVERRSVAPPKNANDRAYTVLTFGFKWP